MIHIKKKRSFRKEIGPSEYDYVRSTGTPTYSFSTYGNISGVSIAANLVSPSRFINSFEMYLPSSPSNGCFLERGGASIGMWVGVRDSGTTFRFRAGDAANSTENTQSIFLDVPVSNMPFDGSIHNVIVDCKYIGGASGIRAYLWIDRKFVAKKVKFNTTLRSNLWVGSASGVFINGGANVNTVGEPTAAWDNTAGQSYRQFHDQYLIKDGGTFVIE